jgi:hypothetical protein
MTYWGMALFFLMSVSAVYPIVVADTDNENELLGRMAPYQGVLGAVCVLWGVLGLAISPGLGVLAYAILLFEIVLGTMLGASWLSGVLASDESDGGTMSAKLDVYSIPMGILGIALSALWLAYLTSAW